MATTARRFAALSVLSSFPPELNVPSTVRGRRWPFGPVVGLKVTRAF